MQQLRHAETPGVQARKRLLVRRARWPSRHPRAQSATPGYAACGTIRHIRVRNQFTLRCLLAATHRICNSEHARYPLRMPLASLYCTPLLIQTGPGQTWCRWLLRRLSVSVALADEPLEAAHNSTHTTRCAHTLQDQHCRGVAHATTTAPSDQACYDNRAHVLSPQQHGSVAVDLPRWDPDCASQTARPRNALDCSRPA